MTSSVSKKRCEGLDALSSNVIVRTTRWRRCWGCARGRRYSTSSSNGSGSRSHHLRGRSALCSTALNARSLECRSGRQCHASHRRFGSFTSCLWGYQKEAPKRGQLELGGTQQDSESEPDAETFLHVLLRTRAATIHPAGSGGALQGATVFSRDKVRKQLPPDDKRDHQTGSNHGHTFYVHPM